MYFGLTEEQEMIVETVRSFVENEIYPHENLVENKGFVPIKSTNKFIILLFKSIELITNSPNPFFRKEDKLFL